MMPKLNKILLLASFLGFIAIGLFGPLYAIYVKNIGGDILDAGVAYGLFSLVSGIFILSLGRSTFFRKNLRLAVVIGFLLFTIGYAGYFFVTKPLHLFIVQIILGIGGGITEPSWDALFSTGLTAERSAQFWANWAGARDLALGAGALAGGIIVTVFSFTALFLTILVLNIAATSTTLILFSKRQHLKS